MLPLTIEAKPEVFSASEKLLHVAACTSSTVTSIAREHRLSRSHVRDSMSAVALAIEYALDHAFDELNRQLDDRDHIFSVSTN